MFGTTFDGKSITRNVRPVDLMEGMQADYRYGGKWIENLHVDLERNRVTFSIVDGDGLEFARCDMGYEDTFSLVIASKQSARIELSKISDPAELARRAAAYMPDNYSVRQDDEGELLIEGYDYAGWTLAGYVIPRLASGCIFATEVQ